jgi:hypothetical protein
LTKPSEGFKVFTIDTTSNDIFEIGKFDSLEKAKKEADKNSDKRYIGYVQGRGNRIVYSTDRGEHGKL